MLPDRVSNPGSLTYESDALPIGLRGPASRTSDIIRSRKMLKRVGDRRHLCLTPTVVLNHSPMLQFIWTALVDLSKSCSLVRTRFALILYFCMVAHKAACHTLSKAFLKSMKTWYRFC